MLCLGVDFYSHEKSSQLFLFLIRSITRWFFLPPQEYLQNKLEHISTWTLLASYCFEKSPTWPSISHWYTNFHKHFLTENTDKVLAEICSTLFWTYPNCVVDVLFHLPHRAAIVAFGVLFSKGKNRSGYHEGNKN